MLRRSVPHLPQVMRLEWRNSTPRVASTPERRNGNRNLNKYLISYGFTLTICHCATTGLKTGRCNFHAMVVGSILTQGNELLFISILISSLWQPGNSQVFSSATQHARSCKIRRKEGNGVQSFNFVSNL